VESVWATLHYYFMNLVLGSMFNYVIDILNSFLAVNSLYGYPGGDVDIAHTSILYGRIVLGA
jgi:hypothetical protein